PRRWRLVARIGKTRRLGEVYSRPHARKRAAPLRAAARVVMLGRAACLVLAGALASRASAQTIAPADFLPLGPRAHWLHKRASGNGPKQVRLNVVDVNEASSGTRYLVEVPFESVTGHVRLEIATDGRLLLRALEAQVNDIFDDLPFDPEATADI